jgi:hypothetical protein
LAVGERRKKKSYSAQTFYAYLDEHKRSAKYQILWHNCDWAKAYIQAKGRLSAAT